MTYHQARYRLYRIHEFLSVELETRQHAGQPNSAYVRDAKLAVDRTEDLIKWLESSGRADRGIDPIDTDPPSTSTHS